jgi:hypothetical protein
LAVAGSTLTSLSSCLPFSVIALIWDFMESLATARKSIEKIQEIVKKVYSNKALMRTQI